jgi:hypothetical protein
MQAAMARCEACRRDVLVNVDVSFADAGNLEDGQRRRRSAEAHANAEHEAAMERSRAILASA